MNFTQTGRRNFLKAGTALAGAGLLQACGTTSPPTIPATGSGAGKSGQNVRSGGNVLRVFASSGFGEDQGRSAVGLRRLYDAGFTVTNQEACLRRSQRFAGTDAERAADLQDIASGRVTTPKVLMGFRGGYGAMRILPMVDWASLGSRMRENGTLLFGFSDVTAVQLALLAKSGVPSFAGPMLYSDFAKPQPGIYTMQSFINMATTPNMEINVPSWSAQNISAEGMLWGGNLSMVAALAGSPYMPDITGGILFLEDVGEQPYRIERMLYTLHLAGILKKQQAVILGNFRMAGIRDVYDSSYNLDSVIRTVSQAARVPVLTDFPFGHIADKTTFPLGAHAKVTASGGGYSIRFSGYPTLNPATLSLDTLLPAPAFSAGETLQTTDDTVTE